MPPKRTVYILHSLSEPKRPYIGLTHDVRARLADHNAGRCPHTARQRPWQLHPAQRPVPPTVPPCGQLAETEI